MKEVWKDIPNYENYQVSNLGRYKSKKRTIITKQGKKYHYKEKILKLHNYNGYKKVCLSKNGKEKRYFIHILVANLFLNKNDFKSMPVENRKAINLNDLQVNHKDENPSNNKISNLEYCTRLYNCNFGTRKQRISLNNKNQKAVIQFDKNNTFIKEWANSHIAEKDLKIRHIGEVCLGKRKTAGGYIWRFKEE